MVAALVAVVVGLLLVVGIPEGVAGARADHAAQVRAARVTVNIGKYPNTFVNSSLSVYLTPSFLRRMAQIAMAHHLSLSPPVMPRRTGRWG